MANFDFSALVGTSVAFSAAADALALSGDPTGFRFDESGSNVVVTRVSDGAAVTLVGVSQEEFTTGNLLFSGSAALAIFGDNATAALNDNNANTILTFTVPDWNNLIYGMGGVDTLTVGTVAGVGSGLGSNVIFGGSGIADSADGADTIDLGSGSNLVYANGGADTINFDMSVAAGQTATVYGGAGNDSVASAAPHVGGVIIYGGGDFDNINVHASNTGDSTIYGGSGVADSTDSSDTVQSGLGNALIYGNAGNDTITTGAVISGKAQSVYGGLGNDTVTAGALAAGAGVLFSGGAGTDTVTVAAMAAGSSATIYGGDGVADSADGADTLTTGTGNALVYANAGNDAVGLAVITASNTQIVYLGLGDDSVTMAGASGGASVMIIYGNEGADNFTNASNHAGGVTIEGGDGNDVIAMTGANSGRTSVAGGEGNDSITIGAYGTTTHTISGGAGADTVVTGALGGGAAPRLYVDLGDGADVITLGAHAAGSITTVLGGEGIDSVVGTASLGSVSVEGGAGADTILGGTIADTLLGGDDADTVSGAAGADSMDGGEGADTLVGGTGIDTITGGAGIDLFDFSTIVLNTNRKSITDFTADSGGDVFRFDAATFTDYSIGGTAIFSVGGAAVAALTAGVDNVVIRNTAANILLTTPAAGVQAVIAVATDTGNIYYDADGNFTAGAVVIGSITIAQVAELSADNFLFV